VLTRFRICHFSHRGRCLSFQLIWDVFILFYDIHLFLFLFSFSFLLLWLFFFNEYIASLDLLLRDQRSWLLSWRERELETTPIICSMKSTWEDAENNLIYISFVIYWIQNKYKSIMNIWVNSKAIQECDHLIRLFRVSKNKS
jgi:hypothetical protein